MRYRIAAVFLVILVSVSRAEEKSFDSNGVKINFLDEGQGEAVVLLHGFGVSASEMWVRMPFAKTQLLPELAKQYRVIAPDLRGHGKSGKPHDPKQYGKEMAEDVVRLLDHLKIKKAHAVGYSMGSAVAGRLLASHPNRLLSVTFGGGGPLCRTPKELTAAVAATAESLEQGKGIGPLIIALAPEGQKLSPEQAEELSGKLLGQRDQKALAAVLRGQSGLEVTVAELRANKIPVRFVYGSRETLLKKLAIGAMKLLPETSVELVEDGDHFSTAGSQEFHKAVQKFLKANSP